MEKDQNVEVANTEATKEPKAKEPKAKEPKKFLVKTPVEKFNGEVAGVQFAYGQAEVYEGYILDWFKKKGYKVTAL